MISSDNIEKSLNTRIIGRKIDYHELIDSTNAEALRLINDSQASHGEIIIASGQTSGKGQQDHKWASPGGGLYMSIITVSKVTEDSNLITFVSGIACIDAIKAVTKIQPELKWVNDIVLNGQKLGGILTETITRGNISTSVTGMGINVNAKISNASDNKFQPVSLYEILGEDTDINLLIAEICNAFEYYFDIYQQDSSRIISKWLEYSNIKGDKISFVLDNKSHSGVIEGINELGHLIVRSEDNIYILSSSRNLNMLNY